MNTDKELYNLDLVQAWLDGTISYSDMIELAKKHLAMIEGEAL